ncbi:mannitol dehydrogenase family protein [Microbacterium gorillae]|uniref:mannitol dehydrogenase family protein n=1 Tax=Microbacterium gorillae TaxID=1231063 RepID=UPI000693C773|nr:mannitol dehydrogenase family protein [Microbacterium gorillae]
MSSTPTDRTGDRAPVRAAHLGLGAFHRAHQAWYTERATAAGGEPWGIVAFTGTRPDQARRLAAQNCRYTLVTDPSDPATDETIAAIVAAHDGADAVAWRAALREVGVLTVTITEAAYILDADRAESEAAAIRAGAFPSTAVGRLLDGLLARRASGGGPIAVVACDNLPGNGRALAGSVRALADAVDPDLGDWLERSVSFVCTVVDRITPAVDSEALGRRIDGQPDRCAVLAETYSSWILQGDFPAGRPAWERAGAVFVDAIEPFEMRKLWLLNGAHTLLSCWGVLRGHATVAEAIRDPACRTAVERLWADAAAVLPLPAAEVAAECARLLTRFEDTVIEHRLAQIGRDAELKMNVRIGAPMRARVDAGLGAGSGQVFAVAAWAVAASDGVLPEQRHRGQDPVTLARTMLHAHGADGDEAELRTLIARIRKGELS